MPRIPINDGYRVFWQSRDGAKRGKYEIMTEEDTKDELDQWRSADPSRIYWVDKADALGSKPPI